ncbi:hypothetical protein ACFV98_16305 [Streptomyces violascens]|uniref:hypothetical protein n=1 Tax=Streptomyces violascens TaxID=67381 RepID=UPI00364A0C75
MAHEDHLSQQSDTDRGPMARMETYERPAARTPTLRRHYPSSRSPDGEGRGGNDPIHLGL